MSSLIQCVECGTSFDVEDADPIAFSGDAVRCPECGRCNYCPEEKEVSVEGLNVDGEDTDEIFTENYLSDDLEYDGVNRFDDTNQKRIGVAKKANRAFSEPMLEYRRVIASHLPKDYVYNKKDFRTRESWEDAMFEDGSVEDAEQ